MHPLRAFEFGLLATLACAVASCDAGAEDREARVVNALVRAEELNLRSRPALVAGKYARMASDFYSFFRGEVPVYVRDLLDATDGLGASKYAVTSPRVPTIGDAHPENFGTLHSASGTGNFEAAASLEANDFDAAERLPYLVDLRRLCIGLAVATRVANSDDAVAHDAAMAKLDTIVGAVARAYGESMIARDRGIAPPALDTSGVVIADVFRRSDRDAPKHVELTDLTLLNGSTRTIKRGVLDPASPEQGYLDAPAVVHAHIDELFAAYQRVLPLTLSNGFFRVKDIVREVGSGVASWSKIRFIVLTEGPTSSPEDDVMFEVKELADSSWPAFFPPLTSASTNAERVRTFAHRAFSNANVEPLWQAVPWLGMEWQVRREASSNKTVRTVRLVAEQGKPEAIASLARALGLTLAAIHAGGSAVPETGAIHAIATAIGTDLDGFVAEQARIGITGGSRVEADWHLFQHAVSTRGLTLGFTPAQGDAPPVDVRSLIGTPLTPAHYP